MTITSLHKPTILMMPEDGAPDAAAGGDEPGLPDAVASGTALESALDEQDEQEATGAAQPSGDAAAAAQPDPAAGDQEPQEQELAIPELEMLAALEGRGQYAPQPQQPAQPAGFSAEALAAAIARAQSADPLNQLLRAQIQRQTQALPPAPEPPGPDANAQDWAQYAARAAEHAAAVTERRLAQNVSPLERQVQQLIQAQQQFQQRLEQNEQQRRAQQYEAALGSAIHKIGLTPSAAWLNNGPPDEVRNRHAVVAAIYRQAGGALTLPQVVEQLKRSFGVSGPAPRPAQVSQRDAAQKALQVGRERVKNAGATPARGAGAGSAPKTLEQKLRESGQWDTLPPDLQEMYRIRDRKRMN